MSNHKAFTGSAVATPNWLQPMKPGVFGVCLLLYFFQQTIEYYVGITDQANDLLVLKNRCA